MSELRTMIPLGDQMILLREIPVKWNKYHLKGGKRLEKGYQLLLLGSISWQQYMIVVTVAVSAYYLFVIAFYYRKEVLKLSRLEWQRNKPPAQPTTQLQDALAANDALLFSSVQQLIDELKIVFQSAVSKQFQQEEILMAIQVKLSSYQQLKGTPFQVAINNFIAQQAQSQCEILLEDAEIKQLW
jgi:hypothetical protein